MLKVKFRKYHKGNRRGDVVSVTNNEAFGLIEMRIADITNESLTTSDGFYDDKMMIAEQIKTYKIK